LGHGRLNLLLALGSLTPTTTSDFNISAAPSNLSVAAGQSASYTASVTPVGGFKGIVTLTCAGAPAASTCSISPSSVTLDGNDPATATVTLTTTARSFFLLVPRPRLLILGKLVATFVAYLLLCAMLWTLARTPRKRLLLAATLTVPIALLFVSCGGTTSSSTITNPPPPQSGGTPQGAFTIAVTGSTSTNLSHTTNVQLKVN
jgi:hypothetical protein